jgi:hypothetical protein
MRLVRNDLLLRLGSRRSGPGVARRHRLACRSGDLDPVSEVLAELIRPSVQGVLVTRRHRSFRPPGALRPVAPAGAAPAASERATFALAFASTYAVEPAAAVPLADPVGLACRQPVTVMASLGAAAVGSAAGCGCDCAPIVMT